MPKSLKRLKFVATQWSRRDPAIKTWESLSEEERHRLCNVLVPQPGELPLAVALDVPNPLVLSNHRLVWLSGEQVIDLDLNRIVEIHPPKDWNYDKLSLHTLVIKTDDSKQYLLEVPMGSTCFSIWNLILNFKQPGAGKPIN